MREEDLNTSQSKSFNDSIEKIKRILFSPISLEAHFLENLILHKNPDVFNTILRFIKKLGIKKIKASDNNIHFRFFFEQQGEKKRSLHVILSKKDKITVNAHIDIGVHDQVLYNKLTTIFLKELCSTITSIYPSYKVEREIHATKKKIILIDIEKQRESYKEEIETLLNKKFDYIVLKASRKFANNNLAKSKVIELIRKIFNQEINMKDPFKQKLLINTINKDYEKLLEKIKITKKNLRNKKNILINKGESFKWEYSEGELPKSLKRYIKRQEKAGKYHLKYEINGINIPTSFKKIGVYNLVIQKKDGFIVSGLLDRRKSRIQEIIKPIEVKKQSIPLVPIVTKKMEQIIGYFNENTIEEICGKLGDPSWKRFNKFLKAYWDYVKERFEKEIGMGTASKKEKNKIYILSRKKCKDFLREYYRKKLN